MLKNRRKKALPSNRYGTFKSIKFQPNFTIFTNFHNFEDLDLEFCLAGHRQGLRSFSHQLLYCLLLGSLSKCIRRGRCQFLLLLAPQSSAHRRGAYKDFHPIKSIHIISCELKNIYINVLLL